MRRLRLPGLTLGRFLLLLALVSACAHQPPRLGAPGRRTCLVLSVGGPAGVAHVGAIEAVVESGIPIQCVVGNSMGALVGSLYASAPQENLDTRFRQFVSRYVEATKDEAGDNGTTVAIILGGLAAAATGGLAAPLVAGAIGGMMGAEGTVKVQHERFVRVLKDFLGGATIETLPVRYLTFYQEATDTGLLMRTADSGPLADAVGKSVANPLIFPDVGVRSGEQLDPGADRAAATPVSDACRQYPDADLIAVNVTGRPLLVEVGAKCRVFEIAVPVPVVSAEQVFALGDEYSRIVGLGREAARGALRRYVAQGRRQ